MYSVDKNKNDYKFKKKTKKLKGHLGSCFWGWAALGLWGGSEGRRAESESSYPICTSSHSRSAARVILCPEKSKQQPWSRSVFQLLFVFLAAAQAFHSARDLLRQEKDRAVASEIMKMGPVAFQAFLGLSWRQAGPPWLSYKTSKRWAHPRRLLRVSERREAKDGAREGGQRWTRKDRSWEEGNENYLGTEKMVPVYLSGWPSGESTRETRRLREQAPHSHKFHRVHSVYCSMHISREQTQMLKVWRYLFGEVTTARPWQKLQKAKRLMMGKMLKAVKERCCLSQWSLSCLYVQQDQATSSNIPQGQTSNVKRLWNLIGKLWLWAT